MRRGRVFVGTSGWIYPHWNGRFYPAGLPARRQLAFMASQLSTVEVNGTFYSLSRPHCFQSWRAETPDDFVFAVKGSRYLTHMLKLKDPKTPLANFFAQGLLLLGRKLGPLLWQLPPMLAFHADKTRAFFELLPRDLGAAERLARKHDQRLAGRSALRAPDGHDRPLRHALEIRHASWLGEEALQLMCAHDVALVTADTADHHPLSSSAPATPSPTCASTARASCTPRATPTASSTSGPRSSSAGAPAAATSTSTSTTTTRPTPPATRAASSIGSIHDSAHRRLTRIR